MNKTTCKAAALFMSLSAMTLFSSCSNSDETPVAPQEDVTEITHKGTVTEVSLRNPGYGEDNWIYFSLTDGEELKGINESNRMTDTTWDIAFYRYNVRTNSGLSGKGNCGAYDTEKLNMKEVTAVPSGMTLTVDEMGIITTKFTGSGVLEAEAPQNKKLGEAISFQGPPPVYTPNGHVYIVKTLKGQYVKMQFTGFANKKGKSGHLQFRYEFLK